MVELSAINNDPFWILVDQDDRFKVYTNKSFIFKQVIGRN